MKKSFYSHGKLLITGEYMVLDGVTAFAIPTQKGQWLHIEENNTKNIHWKSLDQHGHCWFETLLTITDRTIDHLVNDNEIAATTKIVQTLISILEAAKNLNPNFLSNTNGYSITTKLEFDREWGLGSSSTLINNIAQWAQVNAFTLLETSFGGSGYDIACAQYDTAITYIRNGNKPVIKEIDFNPSFKNQVFFVYLNQKQNSKESIKHYQSLSLKEFDASAEAINSITQKISTCDTISQFETLINQHEEIVANIIKTSTIKSQLFANYPRSIKSLGGWGGDFVLVTGTIEEMEYFSTKGYTTIIPYSEMALM